MRVVGSILKIGLVTATAMLSAGVCAYLALTWLIGSEDTVTVPDLVGRHVVTVLEQLTDLGLNTKVNDLDHHPQIPRHHVIRQRPPAQTAIKAGRDVRLVLSRGPRTVVVPNLTGLPLTQAQIILEDNGLHRGLLAFTHTPGAPRDVVMTLEPSPGQSVERGSAVNLLVSLGSRPLALMMPDLRGHRMDEAVRRIEGAGLRVGRIAAGFERGARLDAVIGQQPPAGSRVTADRPVDLAVQRPPGSPAPADVHPATGAGLVRHRVPDGFVKHHIRVRLAIDGRLGDIFDDLVAPGSEIWLLIPQYPATVMIYDDDELIRSTFFDTPSPSP